jgi:hypothetical protein
MASFHLLQAGMIWDASVLLRCISEAACKILFLCHAPPEEREKRIDEFRNGLADIRKLKSSERIKNLIGADPAEQKDDSSFWLALQILSEEEEAEIRSRSTRRDRKQLEQKWSFFEMLADIERDFSSRGDTFEPAVLVLAYGRSSSLIHADEMAMILMEDYGYREPSERYALLTLHLCRHLQNIVGFAAACLSGLFHVYSLKHDEKSREIAILCTNFVKNAEEIGAGFYATQEAFAERIKSGKLTKEELRV